VAGGAARRSAAGHAANAGTNTSGGWCDNIEFQIWIGGSSNVQRSRARRDGDLRGRCAKEILDEERPIFFQSTVFTSILENDFRQRLAKRMWKLTKPGGIVLWYDFEFNNPRNPNVRGVPWREVRAYFPHATHVMKKKTTLAPPIGRRVGRLYNFLDFPFLRTHCIAAFRKDRSR
jgi:hypothetical protein